MEFYHRHPFFACLHGLARINNSVEKKKIGGKASMANAHFSVGSPNLHMYIRSEADNLGHLFGYGELESDIE